MNEPIAQDPRCGAEIVVTSLPAYTASGGLRGWHILVPTAFLVALLLEVARTGRVWLPAFICGALLAGLGIRLLLKSWRRRSDLVWARERSNSAPWHATVATASVESARLWLAPSIQARWQRLLLDRPPTVLLDEVLAPTMMELRAPEALLEPEPINQSMREALLFAGIMAFFALQNTFTSGAQTWWRAIVFWLAAGVFALQVPAIRDRIPGLRQEGQDLVAGPGWLRDRTRRWTVADSTAIVFRTRDRKPGVVIRFIGPQGVRDVQFASPDNPDLRLLWERWTHPQPRLELEA